MTIAQQTPAVLGPQIFTHLGCRFEWRATGRQTGGALALAEVTFVPGMAVPLHTHAREDELYHVLTGALGFQLGEERMVAGPGMSVWAPRRVPHAFAVGDSGARALLWIAPAGLDDFFFEFPDDGSQPDLEAMGRRTAELGITPMGPPPPGLAP